MTNPLALAVLIAASIAAAPSHAEERSLHLMPAGTVVKDKFTLVGKTVPLPEGEFVFVASQVRDATHVRGEWVRQRVQLLTVYLVQLADEQVQAEVLATTVLDPRFTYSKWEDEPVLARRYAFPARPDAERRLSAELSHGQSHHRHLYTPAARHLWRRLRLAAAARRSLADRRRDPG